MIENLAEPTHVGLYKYSTKRAVEVLEFDEAAAAA